MLKDKLVTQGNTVGKYRIEARIAEGGMGVFWRAVDTKLDRTVGLKTLHAEFSVEPQLRDRFVNEARALARLNHPNICVLHDFFESGEQLYIVMEYIQGETLADLVRHRGALPHADVVPLFRQILLALDYAHNHGVIHRDIKPSNIMVTEQGMAKVMDFGIAKMVEAPIQLTRTGRKVGSLLFMSPEQIREQPVDHRSDLYSLGVTLYQVCTGKVPFDATSEYEAMKAHLEEAPPPPRSLNPALSQDLEYVILRALAKRPEDRFQSANEMRAALGTSDPASTSDRVVVPSGERTRVDSELPTHPRAKRKGMVWLVASGVVAFALAGYVALKPGAPAPKVDAPVPKSVTEVPSQAPRSAATSPGSIAGAGTVPAPAATDTAITLAAGAPASSGVAGPAPAPPPAADSAALARTSSEVSAVPANDPPAKSSPVQAARPPEPKSKSPEGTASERSGSSPRSGAASGKAREPKPPEPPRKPVVLAKYSLQVEVKPAGKYQVDRSGFGRAAARMDEGKHQLEAMGPGFPIVQQSFVLRRDTTIVVDLEAAAERASAGDLRVSARSNTGAFPACQLLVNGERAGELPSLRLPLRAGLYELELIAPDGLRVDSLQFEGTTHEGSRARVRVPPTSRSFARYYLTAEK